MIRLHGFSQSGNTFKVAFFLRTLGLPFEPVFVDFMRGATREPEWRAGTNEMGEVPVFEDGGMRLTQSGVILSHLAQQHGSHGGKDEDERREVLRWLFYDNHKLTSYLASYRFMKAFAPTPPDPAVLAWLHGRMDIAFRVLDKHLAQRPWVVGDAPTIADFSICGYLFYPVEESGYDVAGQFAHIAAWLERLRALPGFASPYDVLPGARLVPKW